MDYPHDFPAESRAKVEASRIRAGRKFDLAINRIRGPAPSVVFGRFSLDELADIFWNYALTPFLTFSEEAYRLRLWAADEMRLKCEELLRRLIIDAYYRKGKGTGVRDPISNTNGSIQWEAQQEIEKRLQWRRYENLLLKLAEESPIASFHVGLIERNQHLLGNVSREENHSSTASKADSNAAKLPEGNTREAVLKPILYSKGLSVHDWANNAGVDFHTADDYLKDRTNPRPSTRLKLARSLDIKIEQLPE